MASASTHHYVQQTGANYRAVLMWLVVSILSLLFVALIVAAPLAFDSHHAIAGTIYKAFRHLCHQIPERSFFLHQHPFAVCARCTGIYAGFAVSCLAYPVLWSLRQTEAPARKWLFIAVAPLAVDWGIEFFGVMNNSYTSRFVTGAILGATVVFYILPGLVELSLREWRGENPRSHISSFPATVINGDAPSDYSAPHRRI